MSRVEESAAPHRWMTASGNSAPVTSHVSTIHDWPCGASLRLPMYTAQCVNGTSWSSLGQYKISPGVRRLPSAGQTCPRSIGSQSRRSILTF